MPLLESGQSRSWEDLALVILFSWGLKKKSKLLNIYLVLVFSDLTKKRIQP